MTSEARHVSVLYLTRITGGVLASQLWLKMLLDCSTTGFDTGTSRNVQNTYGKQHLRIRRLQSGFRVRLMREDCALAS